jgi:hypothetical protein
MLSAKKIAVPAADATLLVNFSSQFNTAIIYLAAGTMYLGGPDVDNTDGFPITGPVTLTLTGASSQDDVYAYSVGGGNINVLARTSNATEPTFGP